MASRAIRAFPWDFADEGIEEVLDRLRDSGVDGVNLALAYHGGRFYCPHNPKHTIIHAPEGVVYFQPLLSCYEDGLTPLVHREFGDGYLAGRLGAALREYEMNFTAWVVLFNNRSLSYAYPDCTCVNVFGDVLEGALCPSNPAVRTYAMALVEDLAHRVGVDAIELEDFSFTSHTAFTGTRWQGIEIGPALGYLMSLCLCEHCARHAEEANIDIDDLKRRLRHLITYGLSGDLSDRRIGDEIIDPYNPVSRFAAVRGAIVTSLLDELVDAAEGSAAILQPILHEEPDDIWRWGVELHTLRQRLMRATISPPERVKSIQAHIDRYVDLLRLEDSDLAVDIHLCEEGMTNCRDFRTMIESCLTGGIDHFVFSTYGLVRLDLLDWISVLAKR